MVDELLGKQIGLIILLGRQAIVTRRFVLFASSILGCRHNKTDNQDHFIG